jgi:transcriptional regulator with XRE-family HTH domain
MFFEQGKFSKKDIATAVIALIEYLKDHSIEEKEIAEKIGLSVSQISQSMSIDKDGYRHTAAYAVLYGVQIAYGIDLEIETISPKGDKTFWVKSNRDTKPFVSQDSTINEQITTSFQSQLDTFRDVISTTIREEIANLHSDTENGDDFTLYRGKYHAYWLSVGAIREVRKRYELSISPKKATIKYSSFEVEGKIEYRGSCLYIYFDDKLHEEKKRLLIIYVGGGVIPPQYLSGLYLTTDDNSDAVAGPMLFVRQKDNATDDISLISRFFHRNYPSERDRHFFFKNSIDHTIYHLLKN